MTKRAVHCVLLASSSLVAWLALAAWSPAPADACSCPDTVASVAWPPDGATGVAPDATLVLLRLATDGNTDRIGYALLDSQGAEQALMEVERIEQPFEGCAPSEVLFLRARDGLQPGESYTFAPALPNADGERFGASFTVASGVAGPARPPAPELLFTRVRDPDSCGAGTCATLGVLDVELPEPPEGLFFLEVVSGAAEAGRASHAFGPDGGETHAQLTVQLASEDDCIDVRGLDLRARAVVEQRLCEPDRCADFGRWGHSTCGGPPSSGVAPLRLADDSCGDPPVLGFEVGVGPVYPDPHAGMPSGGGAGGGCTVGRGAGTGWQVYGWLALLLGLRRRGRGGPPSSAAS